MIPPPGMRRRALALAGGLALWAGFVLPAAAAPRSVVRFGSDVVVEEGQTVRDAVAIGGAVTVRGRVEHDAVSVGGTVTLGPRARVGHNVVSVGGSVVQSEGARIDGDVVDVQAPGVSSASRKARATDWGLVRTVSRIAAFLGLVALALLVVAVMPKGIDRIGGAIEHRPGLSVLWGVVGLMAVVPVALLLVVSIAGILLIPLELLFVVAVWLLGYVATARVAGKKMFALFGKRGRPAALETLAGIIVLGLAAMVPFFGWLVSLAVLVLGFGGVIIAFIERHRPPAGTGAGARA